MKSALFLKKPISKKYKAKDLYITFVYICNMNLIIADSSTLILLAKINLLRNVYLYFNNIIISETVFKETVESGKMDNKEDSFIIEKEINEGRIIIEKIKDKKILNEILTGFRCHLGEAEALTLAINKKSRLFVDDLEAIKICKIYNIEFITALAFLIKLVQDNQIDNELANIKFNEISKLGYYSKEIIKCTLEEINKKWNK